MQLQQLLQALARHTLCRMGHHSQVTGAGLDLCTRGCGHAHNPNAAQPYDVTLRDGSILTVHAVNEHHAINLAMYGGPIRLHRDGSPSGDVKIHRVNIMSVVRSAQPSFDRNSDFNM